jgi:acylphosphatase
MQIRIVVSGLVQGVNFRYFTLKQAQKIGIKGYVRNLPDGSVEAVADGENWMIDEFTKQLKTGPPISRVTGINVQPVESDEEFDGFEIRY